MAWQGQASWLLKQCSHPPIEPFSPALLVAYEREMQDSSVGARLWPQVTTSGRPLNCSVSCVPGEGDFRSFCSKVHGLPGLQPALPPHSASEGNPPRPTPSSTFQSPHLPPPTSHPRKIQSPFPNRSGIFGSPSLFLLSRGFGITVMFVRCFHPHPQTSTH